MFGNFLSQRGRKLFVYEGYIFNEDRKEKQTTRYRCQNRLCKGSIIINEREEILACNEQNHDPPIKS
jgi:hypothetical protein